MASSGNPTLPPPTPVATTALLAPLPKERNRESMVADAIARQLPLGSPDYPTDPQDLRAMYETE